MLRHDVDYTEKRSFAAAIALEAIRQALAAPEEPKAPKRTVFAKVCPRKLAVIRKAELASYRGF